jgi:hypothetical protein
VAGGAACARHHGRESQVVFQGQRRGARLQLAERPPPLALSLFLTPQNSGDTWTRANESRLARRMIRRSRRSIAQRGEHAVRALAPRAAAAPCHLDVAPDVDRERIASTEPRVRGPAFPTTRTLSPSIHRRRTGAPCRRAFPRVLEQPMRRRHHACPFAAPASGDGRELPPDGPLC